MKMYSCLNKILALALCFNLAAPQTLLHASGDLTYSGTGTPQQTISPDELNSDPDTTNAAEKPDLVDAGPLSAPIQPTTTRVVETNTTYGGITGNWVRVTSYPANNKPGKANYTRMLQLANTTYVIEGYASDFVGPAAGKLIYSKREIEKNTVRGGIIGNWVKNSNNLSETFTATASSTLTRKLSIKGANGNNVTHGIYGYTSDFIGGNLKYTRTEVERGVTYGGITGDWVKKSNYLSNSFAAVASSTFTRTLNEKDATGAATGVSYWISGYTSNFQGDNLRYTKTEIERGAVYGTKAGNWVKNSNNLSETFTATASSTLTRKLSIKDANGNNVTYIISGYTSDFMGGTLKYTKTEVETNATYDGKTGDWVKKSNDLSNTFSPTQKSSTERTLTERDAQGVRTNSYSYTHDSTGLMTRKVTRMYQADGITLKSTDDYRYVNGLKTTRSYYQYDAVGDVNQYTVYTFHPDGITTKFLDNYYYRIGGIKNNRDYSVYNIQGIRTQFTQQIFQSNGKVLISTVYNYAAGKLTQYSQKSYNSLGTVTASSVINYPQKILTKDPGLNLGFYVDGTLHNQTITLQEGAQTIQKTVPGSDGIPVIVEWIITRDTAKPTGTVTINSGASFTKLQAVTLSLNAIDVGSGVDKMSFSNDNVTWTTAEAYAASKAFTLLAGDGTKTVYVKYFDKAGNASVVYSKSIILDKTAPSGSIKINNGANYTKIPTVTLNLTAVDSGSGINKMSFRINFGPWSAAEDYAASKTFNLPPEDGQTSTTVFVRYFDKAGNVSTYSGNIKFDTISPTGSIDINNGAAITANTKVILNLSAYDLLSGVSQMSFSKDNVTWTAAEAYATSKNFTLPTGNGAKTVYVKFFDKAGNVSAVYSKSIILDPSALVLQNQNLTGFVGTRKTMILGPLADSNGNPITYNFTASPDLASSGGFILNKNQLTYVPFNDSSFVGTGQISITAPSLGSTAGAAIINLEISGPLLSPSNDSLLNYQYALRNVGAMRAWNLSRGAGILVSVIDTGIDYNHADLNDTIFRNINEIAGDGIDNDNNGFTDDIHGWDFGNNDNNPSDNHEHGTHVSGIIAAENNNGIGGSGIAPSAKLLPVKVENDNEPVTDLTINSFFTTLVNAINYSVKLGARVINMSLGAPTALISASVVQLIQDAVDAATAAGVIIVAGAGNDNASASGFTPAALNNVITIAATKEDDTIASYSNYGNAIDFSAPGSDVLSTVGSTDYAYFSGTSMASPMVAGIAALLLAQDPTAKYDDVYRRLKYSSLDLGTPGFDGSFGYGRVDAFKALSYDYYDNGTIKTQWLETPNEHGWNRLNFDSTGYLTGGSRA